MKTEILFEIAKIVDNEYIGTEKTFTAERRIGYWILDTNKCDNASLIKVYGDGDKISFISWLGEGVGDWTPVSLGGINRINIMLHKNGLRVMQDSLPF